MRFFGRRRCENDWREYQARQERALREEQARQEALLDGVILGDGADLLQVMGYQRSWEEVRG